MESEEESNTSEDQNIMDGMSNSLTREDDFVANTPLAGVRLGEEQNWVAQVDSNVPGREKVARSTPVNNIRSNSS